MAAVAATRIVSSGTISQHILDGLSIVSFFQFAVVEVGGKILTSLISN